MSDRNNGCKKSRWYEARYKFRLKDGGNGKKLTLRSGWVGSSKFKRTVYSSAAQYNKSIKNGFDVLEELLSGDDSTPTPTPLPAPVWSLTDANTWSSQEVNFVRYLRTTFGSRNQLESCQLFANPALAASNGRVYDLAADRGVTLHGVDRARARQLAQRFYSNYCNDNYGLPSRILLIQDSLAPGR